MSTDRPSVAVIGSLDTKSEEFAYALTILRRAGIDPVMIDCGVVGDPAWQPDIGADEVARAAGHSLAEMRGRRHEAGERGRIIEQMAQGTAVVTRRLYDEGRIAGAFGMGGGQGSTMVSASLRALPVGVPKMLLSTMTPDNAGGYFGGHDLAFLYSIADISGLNRVTRQAIANAANAVAGMVLQRPDATPSTAPLIGITMFGTTTRAGHRIQERLHAAGFETVVFHAVGSGGRVLDGMIDAGEIAGVVDLTPSEVTDDLFGGVFTAGPDRMRAATRAAIPRVVVPGAAAQITFGARPTVPGRFLTPNRVLLSHSPTVTIVRANATECAQIGKELMDRIDGAVATEVVLPRGGLSDYEMAGAALDDPDADEALFDAVRASAPAGVPVLDRPEDINAPTFADFVVDRFLALWNRSLT
ncbi:Tm-1-like ATP-binding domain-containing protein [Phytohabitans sp. ZYX-F-186]|uniref:Tm-1-like ATP-binding domain-containing protein n=1 Tax=Phytohabitans maris TaxID=3071409 RepID=A0ABU0ZKH2_9ACTN|nr:Tm-1-like ATP-binding domain-containing protein [Phytohabitans sp. ZYX-F-186]MDQ7907543.1 Tm-1-like ATP-binding domain-containing protein [Phytohabitans sp. ZYX-F-186]